MKISIITLGCKLNKYESDCMAQQLLDAGYTVTSNLEKADVYILNTCAVTKESEKKSRQYITKCLRYNPNARIVVCGCASENNAKQFSCDNIIAVLGNAGKDNILQYIKGKGEMLPLPTCYDNLHTPLVSTTRAYLKVQDGCNNFCSYCLIPYVRGRSRSRALDECIAEAHELAKVAHEIVLTGIDLSDYKPSLKQLVERMADVPARFRLGSLEVRVVDKALLQALRKANNFCPQFHLSLQSGDNQILHQMNRHYTAREYLRKVRLIRKYFPNANITTDIIVGFAHETDKQFMNTMRLARRVRFGKIHVFPYSPREGTVAYKLLGDTDGNVKRERVATLSQLLTELEHKFFKRSIGYTCQVLTEEVQDDYVVGYTDNYIKAYLPASTPLGQLINVRLISAKSDGMVAEIMDKID